MTHAPGQRSPATKPGESSKAPRSTAKLAAIRRRSAARIPPTTASPAASPPRLVRASVSAMHGPGMAELTAFAPASAQSIHQSPMPSSLGPRAMTGRRQPS